MDWDPLMCRVCLTTSSENVDLKASFGQKMEINWLEMFNLCTCLGAKPEDDLPKNICEFCSVDLIGAFEFYQKAQNADRLLRSHSQKQTVDDSMTIVEESTISIVKEEHELSNHLDGLFKEENELSTDLEEEYQEKEESYHEKEGCHQEKEECHQEKEEYLQIQLNEDEFTDEACMIYVEDFFKESNIIGLDVIKYEDKDVYKEKNDGCETLDSKRTDDFHNYSEETLQENTEREIFLEIEYEESEKGDVNISSSYDDYIEEYADTKENKKTDEAVEDDERTEIVSLNEEYNSLESINSTSMQPQESESDNEEYYEIGESEDHLLKHPIKNKICLICDKSFVRDSTLDKHVRLKHRSSDSKDVDSIECDICGKSLKRWSLQYHKIRFHNDQKSFLCNACPKTFYTSADLKTHLRTHDSTRKRNFLCNLCPKAFYDRQSRDVHEQRHTGVKPFQCTECSKRFFTRKALEVHCIVHNREIGKFKCNFCSKLFVSNVDLVVHTRFHTGIFPFKCNLCDKSFAVKSHYNYHMAKHEGVTYNCPKCEKQFKNRGSLTSHLLTHRDKMPHCCPICEKGVTTPFALKRHMQTHKNYTVEEGEQRKSEC